MASAERCRRNCATPRWGGSSASFSGRREQVMGPGSGFIVDPSGIIVTNNHVVGHANSIVVSLSDGEQFPAQVLGDDELTDVAVIKVDAPHPLPAVAWGDLHKRAGRRLGARGRQSVRTGRFGDRGHHLGARARSRRRSVRQFPAA